MGLSGSRFSTKDKSLIKKTQKTWKKSFHSSIHLAHYLKRPNMSKKQPDGISHLIYKKNPEPSPLLS